jgi:hypothetical protein
MANAVRGANRRLRLKARVSRFCLLLLITRFYDWLNIQVFDMDHSIRAADLRLIISKAGSGLDPS